MGNKSNCCLPSSPDQARRISDQISSLEEEKVPLSAYFPLDCVGVVVSFISDPKILVNCLSLAKIIYEYLCIEHPGACNGIDFHYVRPKKNKHSRKQPYVKNIVLEKVIDMRVPKNAFSTFCNLRSLVLNGMDKVPVDVLLHCGTVEELVLKSCPGMTLKENCFSKCENLRSLTLEGMTVEEEAFSPLGDLLELQLCSGLNNIQGSCIDMPNLKKLFVIGQPIPDEVFGRFKVLENAKIHYCPNFTGATLQNSPTLRILSLFNNTKIKDEYFSGIVNLEDLEMWSVTSVTDKMFIHVPNLKVLSMNICNQLSGSEFHYLTKLESLIIFDNTSMETQNLLKLRHCPLKALRLKKCEKVTDEIFSGLKLLEDFRVINCQKIGIEGFKNLDRLTRLSICGNNTITDFVLRCLPDVTNLSIWSSSRMTCKNFNYFKNLTVLDLHAKPDIEDDDLECLTRLKMLYLTKTNLTGTFLCRMEALIELWVDGNDRFDSSNFEFVPTVRKLIVLNSPLLKTENIVMLRDLEYISIHFSKKFKVSDIAGLTNMWKLKINQCSSVKKDELKKLSIKEIWWNKKRFVK